jgi:hypothetical protein
MLSRTPPTVASSSGAAQEDDQRQEQADQRGQGSHKRPVVDTTLGAQRPHLQQWRQAG